MLYPDSRGGSEYAAASWSAAVLCRFSVYLELLQLNTSKCGITASEGGRSGWDNLTTPDR